MASDDTAAGQNFNSANTATEGATRGYERWGVHKLARLLGNPRISITLWDGYCVSPEGEDSVGTVHIRNRQALNQLFLKGDVDLSHIHI